ncbi:MAG: 2-oxoacid:acceptor oxidoreductase family protein [Deltaproteobacteria bacterium]|nr:2-oxoacid:acceptor oxidoreductase family protein [Deltaproteobacteria bacterium]
MTDWPVKVRFGGLGGQGLVTMGAVLAEAGSLCGLQVAASQAYGSRARGGATRSDVILSAEEIDFPHVIEPDLLLVLAQEAYELYSPEVAEGGVILADDFFVKVKKLQGIRQLMVAGTSTAVSQVGNKLAANFVMFGSLLGFTELVGHDQVVKAIENIVRERFHDINKKALELGIELGKQLEKTEGGAWR